jgi:hypothetical protein
VGALVNDKQLYTDLEQTTTTLHATMLQAQTGVTDFQENMEALKHNFLLSGYFKKRGYEDSADLGANAIGGLPQGTPVKVFSYKVKQLFDGRDSAKLRNQRSLNAVGEFLAQNQFGVAVITASSGMEGDAQKDTVLTEARAMIVRAYLADNFGFDNSLLKTLGLGKEADSTLDADWGSIQILIFATGTEMPADKPSQPASAPIANASHPLPASSAATQKQ